MADMLYGPTTATGGGDVGEDNANHDFYGGAGSYGGAAAGGMVGPGGLYNNNQPQRPRYPGLYVGNLTWWTTDRDVIDAINSIGVNDVQEVKFFENRNNGQSKGFCVVTFTSDASLPIVMEKLPTKDLHGQNPMVTLYNRTNLNLFESQTKIRPQINSTNGPTSHAAGVMGINSITGVHAAAANAQVANAHVAVANLPFASVNAGQAAGAVSLGYNQAMGMNSLAGAGGPRPPYHTNMRMQMRGPRPMLRGSMPGAMNNGPMIGGGGHQMNRMRFMPQQNWNNSQVGGVGGGGGGGGYNQATNRVGPQMNMDISNRLGGMGGGANKQDDSNSDMMGSSNYYSNHHSNSQAEHYRSDMRDHRDHRDLRDERDSRRIDDRPSRLDERSHSRQDDRPSTRDDRSSKLDDRSERPRRDERSSRKADVDDSRGSRRSGTITDDKRDKDDRSSRREEKTSSSSSSHHHRERSHRSDDRGRSRSRSKDRSRDGKERRDRDRDRDRSRKERY